MSALNIDITPHYGAKPRRMKPFVVLGAAVAVGLGAIGAVSLVSAKVELTPRINTGIEPTSAGNPAPSLLNVQLDGRTPEGQLILSYQQLAQGQESQALATVEQLVRSQPNFALAQLLYGDLLLARTPPGTAIDDKHQASPAENDRRDGLREEARLRLAALVERPPHDALPRELLGVTTGVRHAIVVDTSRARLYLFENSAEGMKLLRDVYVSIGKLGTGKLVEGDLRTPLGTYHVGPRRDVDAAKYGPAALPLNYPNEFDRVAGRSGTSIWLHGERAGSYARGPKSTDGCIALSNDEMRALADKVEARETPVLIVDHIDWVPTREASKPVLPSGFESAFGRWQQARQAQNADVLRGLYEPSLPRGSDSEAERLEQNLARMARQQLPVQALEPISVLPAQGKEPVVIVTYRETSAPDPKPKLKRQYWREQGGQWKIFFDGVVS